MSNELGKSVLTRQDIIREIDHCLRSAAIVFSARRDCVNSFTRFFEEIRQINTLIENLLWRYGSGVYPDLSLGEVRAMLLGAITRYLRMLTYNLYLDKEAINAASTNGSISAEGTPTQAAGTAHAIEK